MRVFQVSSQILIAYVKFGTTKARGVHSLLYFAYMCVQYLFIGGLFILQKGSSGDGILHVKSMKILHVMVFYM